MTSPPLTAQPAAKPNYNFNQPVSAPPAGTGIAAQPKPKPAGMSTFDDLWTSSLSTVSTSAPGQGGQGGGKKSLNEMEQQKSVDKLWGTGGSGMGVSGGAGAGSGGPGNDFDDLLL